MTEQGEYPQSEYLKLSNDSWIFRSLLLLLLFQQTNHTCHSMQHISNLSTKYFSLIQGFLKEKVLSLKNTCIQTKKNVGNSLRYMIIKEILLMEFS
jgi:hypothetical protein